MEVLKIMPEEAGQRIDKILAQRLPDFSREQVQKIIKEGGVQINGKLVKPSLKPEAGDTLTITLPEPKPSDAVPAQPLPLEILYEDDYLAVINKPAGLVVHPAQGNEENTLVNALIARWEQLKTFSEPERAGIVHRLDKDTSGVLVVAMSEAVRYQLMSQFKERTIQKIYRALVDGRPRTESGRIELALARDPNQPKRMAVSYMGKPAITEFRTLEKFEEHTFLELDLKTGRTHQLRVHLAFIGCPIVGDRVYGLKQPSIELNRVFLHAKSIRFRHPISGAEMFFETDLPEPLQHVLEGLRKVPF